MKVARDELFTALSKLSPLFSRGENGDITGSVVFRPDEWPKATLFSTRMTSTVSCTVSLSDVLSMDKNGKKVTAFKEFAVNGKTLIGLLSKLSGVIELKAIQGSLIELSCGRSTYELQCLPAINVPSSVLDEATGDIMVIDGESFKDALHYASRFNSKDQSRGALFGVQVVIEPTEDGSDVKVASSDGYRAACFTKKTKNKIKTKVSIVISREHADELKDLLEDESAALVMITSSTRTTFMLKNHQYTIQQMAFPVITMIFNIFANAFSKACIVTKREWSDAMARIGKVQDDEYSRINIILKKDSMEIKKFDISKGKAREIIPVTASSFDVSEEVSFTSFLLFSCYQAFDKCNSMKIETLGANGAISMVKISSPEKPELETVIVPVVKGAK